MSNDSKTGQSPGTAAPARSLEDAVYSPHLVTGRDAINRGNPLITLPITILMYAAFIGTGMWLGAQTSVGKKALKTVGVDLMEKPEDVPPPPPPPPPPAPVTAVVVKRDLEVKEPPPPPDPNKDMVPDLVPKELPKEDRSAQYAVGGTTAAASSVVGAGTSHSVVGSGTSSRVVEFDFTQIREKIRPPAPPYPAMAKIAKIQGTVVVEIVIGPDGVPISARAVDGPPQLRPTAENYAMQWRFEPALMNGQPVNARFKLTMPFRLR